MGGEGVKNVEKMTTPRFGVENHESFGFFSILSRKSPSGSMGFVWGGVGRVLMQLMHFSAIFAMLAFSATSVTLWYPLGGV